MVGLKGKGEAKRVKESTKTYDIKGKDDEKFIKADDFLVYFSELPLYNTLVLLLYNGFISLEWLIFALAIVIRLGVGLGAYSGFSTPPMYGDFEAQRNWISTTFHFPITEWYFYDLQYWGLDYPPLTAYHSLLMGYIINLLELDEIIAPLTSRGIENDKVKGFMRASALISDILIFFVPCWFLLKRFGLIKGLNNNILKYFGLSLLLFNPLFILIDHGHFQYNCIMLGLFLLTIYFIMKNQLLLSCICFVLCLNFKQMALYYSLAIFGYLLGQVFHQRSPFLLIKLGIITMLTFITLLLPFLLHKDGGIEQLQQIIFRIFPVARGVFEDKVASFWCSFNIIVKIKNHLEIPQMVQLSALVTLIACLPSLILLLIYPKVSNFLITSTIHSLSFFLFSFQVHEKSILLPALPLILCHILIPNSPITLKHVRWFTNLATFSLYPLLKKDGLTTAYISTLIIFNSLLCPVYLKLPKTIFGFIEPLTYTLLLCLHVLELTYIPPSHLPYLYPTLNALVASVGFLGLVVYLNYSLFRMAKIQGKEKDE